jgi:threonine dehydrogenase-like Zn-dependent dehydrogenase
VRVRAAVMTGPGELEVRTFPVPEPEPGAVLMRVRLSGICGTDKHTFRGETIQYAGTPHERSIQYPLICGHENVGVVEATGGEVLADDGTPLRPGDRIVPGANVPCGECWYCVNDQPYYLCENMEDYGNSLNVAREPSLFGGWSELMYLLPGTFFFRVPETLPSELAALTEILAVTNGLDRARALPGGFEFGATVAVLGVGPLGLMHLAKAEMMGAGALIGVDVMPERLEHARAFGAGLVLDAGRTSPQERLAAVRDATAGLGADVVCSCSGQAGTMIEALDLVRPGGVVIEAGAFVDMGPVPVNPNSQVCSKGVAIIGVGGETLDQYRPALVMLDRHRDRLPFARAITHRVALDGVGDALELAQTGAAMKVLVAPNG